MFIRSYFLRVWIWICSPFIIVLPTTALSQSMPEQTVVPEAATQTQVSFDEPENRYTITNGQQSGDGTNLFHHFERLDLLENTTATFDLGLTPEILNIFNRVTGGSHSEINGLIEVIGHNSANNPNFYLLNPAGVIFGSQASINVPGDFTVSTATSLEFGNEEWLANSTDFNNFDGLPTAFNFESIDGDGILINSGDLAVNLGKNLNFVANTVLNTGTLTASSGNLTITAIPERGTVRLSQSGSLLAFEFEPKSDETGMLADLDFASLLTGSSLETGLVFDSNILKTSSGIELPQVRGLVAIDSDLNFTSGSVQLWGEQLGILSGNVIGKDIDIQSQNSFFLNPDADLIALAGSIDINSPQSGIYGNLKTDHLKIYANTGLEITEIPDVIDWEISADKLEIGLF